MAEAILGRKIGMTQVFAPDGTVAPVTVLQAGPCTVLAVRTKERDGYAAVQLGFAEKPARLATKPEAGHAKKAGATPKRFGREVRWLAAESPKPGEAVTCALFQGVAKVDVIGTMKGRGFTGVIKRHNFKRGPMTHGSKSHRRPGSVGQHTFPARVFPGKKMAGRYGGTRVTVRNLAVVSVDPERHRMLVRGAVPGPAGGYVVVRRTAADRSSAIGSAARGAGAAKGAAAGGKP